VAALMKDVQVVIAHNAKFDRPFVEGRWPLFQHLNWACSINDINDHCKIATQVGDCW
jgi:DNA polymerase-3 subunit epsilon